MFHSRSGNSKHQLWVQRNGLYTKGPSSQECQPQFKFVVFTQKLRVVKCICNASAWDGRMRTGRSLEIAEQTTQSVKSSKFSVSKDNVIMELKGNK